MKFIHYLERISGVGIYPLISLLVFFIFFVVVTWWVFRTDKTHIDQLSHIPLDSTSGNDVNNENS